MRKTYISVLSMFNVQSIFTKKLLSMRPINNTFRMFLGLPRFCSASEMFAHCPDQDRWLYAIIRKKAASLMSRVHGHNSIYPKNSCGEMYFSYLEKVCAEGDQLIKYDCDSIVWRSARLQRPSAADCLSLPYFYNLLQFYITNYYYPMDCIYLK